MVARPVELYVLMPRRGIPPAWLTESFTRTGEEIALDETGVEDDRRMMKLYAAVAPSQMYTMKVARYTASAWRMASRPSEASATTCKPSRSSKDLMPCLTRAWSSARMIRVGMVPHPPMYQQLRSECQVHAGAGASRRAGNFKEALINIHKTFIGGRL